MSYRVTVVVRLRSKVPKPPPQKTGCIKRLVKALDLGPIEFPKVNEEYLVKRVNLPYVPFPIRHKYHWPNLINVLLNVGGKKVRFTPINLVIQEVKKGEKDGIILYVENNSENLDDVLRRILIRDGWRKLK